MKRKVTDEQFIRKLNMAYHNLRTYGILDRNFENAPELRSHFSENFRTVIPNTPENIRKVKAFHSGSLALYGRGPRNHGKNNGKSYYGDNHNYDLKKNPPYVAVYQRKS